MSTPQDNPVRTFRDGFSPGLTEIAAHDGLEMAALCLAAGETLSLEATTETALLLMSGVVSGQVDIDGQSPPAFGFRRDSLFDESASCVHVPAGATVTLRADSATEFTLYRCGNTDPFEARVYLPEDVPNEHRGAGQVAGRCLRFVRTIFDATNAPEGAQLVLGEVVNMPGGWSSYPPHHHDQPEIYHYRFTEPQGYGHAELGDDVYKVCHNDTIRIPAGLDHAQCSAPGYGMYYSWVIRHLPDNPYTVPEFTEAHTWTMEKDARFWWPEGVERDA
ncbi:5-deoxy-glucuronate isomerase [Marinihelvus fidelis]|uniref:5-deoxy-glucuronate isomerase n=1 Tax=Marinihelvus fidelis TaxID=2613842 RepID=A0A5N0TAA6_9GAMM|nr:5-deoxy-glucuronate isomerase [Marinihelvus fidelis]KAA9131618.1 5-deoxy-glucuronate isomerase [Marinihelvus fidelis]